MVPSLSIIIPTKNRFETLVPVLSALCRHVNSPELEIVVEDNSTSVGPEALVDLIASDQRIVYHRDSQPVSIVENTLRAIGHSHGEYLCFIGDDDFVSPYIMTVVTKLRQTGLPCAVFTPARYWWTTVQFARETLYRQPGAFWLPKQHGGGSRVLNAQEELRKVLGKGGVAYMDLPRFYHGIVHRNALERIRNATGTYLPGSSPDMAFSAALALVVERYLFVEYPVTVFGASKNSGGGWTAARRHFGLIEDQPHLPKGIMQRWDSRLPRVWSEQVIYPQTIHEVMQAFGRSDTISYDALYASLLVYESHIFRFVWPPLRRYCRDDPRRVLRIIALCARKIVGRTWLAIQNRSERWMPYELSRFDTVSEAMDFMRNLLPLAASVQPDEIDEATSGILTDTARDRD